MAIAYAAKATANISGFPVAGPATTGSFTPSNNSLLVVIGKTSKEGDAGTDRSANLTITDSAGLTWTSRGNQGSTIDYGVMIRIWTAPVTTGVSMTVSLDETYPVNSFSFSVSVIEVTGYDTGSPIGATAAGALGLDGAQSLTLSGATASTSIVFGGRAMAVGVGTQAATPGAGCTEIHDLSDTDTAGLQTQVRDTGSTSTSFPWVDVQTGTATDQYDCVGVAIEIKEAAGSGTNVTPSVVAVTFTLPTPAISAPVNITATAAAATFTIPTPAVKTGIWDVSDRGARNSTSTGTATVTLTNPTLISVGNYLIARVAVDNSGGSGALPGLAITDSRSHTWTLETGALQDPGVASAGVACYLGYVKVVTPFQAADTVTFTWTTGTPISAIVLEEWAGIDPTTPRAVTSTRANNVSSTAQPTGAITPSAARQLVFVAAAAEQLGTEWGAQDTDTTNGSWVDVTKASGNTGTHDTSMSVYGGTKIVTASGAQTWNNTLSATGDWATVAIVFAPSIVENVYATQLAAAFVIPTPAVSTPTGTNISATAVAATFVVPTPTFTLTTTPTPTAVAGVFVIPTPSITVTTTPTPTAVAATFVVPTPTFNRTTTPTPTVAAATFTIPTPVISTAVSATLAAVASTWTIPTPTVSTGVVASPTAVAATFTIPTPTLTMSANIPEPATAQAWVIPTPSVTTGSNVSIGATAVASTWTIPTPAVSGTQIAATAAAQTWVIPTPAIAGTQIAATVAVQSWTIPTPAVSTSSSTNITATAVAIVATIPTPTFNRTTTPTPTAVAMICAPRTPTFTMTANILATVVAAVFVIRGGTPTGQLIGGDASQAFTQAQGATQTIRKVGSSTITSQGARQEFNP